MTRYFPAFRFLMTHKSFLLAVLLVGATQSSLADRITGEESSDSSKTRQLKKPRLLGNVQLTKPIFRAPSNQTASVCGKATYVSGGKAIAVSYSGNRSLNWKYTSARSNHRDGILNYLSDLGERIETERAWRNAKRKNGRQRTLHLK